jgi:acyl homoserine lactone synthase
MIQLITPERYDDFTDALAAMHRLRYRVFKERLDWDVEVSEEQEFDRFDALRPLYLLQRGPDGEICGCVRLLPSTGSTMLRDVFADLLGGRAAPASPEVWESSRFALDVPANAPKGRGGIAKATYELFAGMVEFGLSRRLTAIVTVTDTRIERILRRAQWPLQRLGAPREVGATRAVAGLLDISEVSLARLRIGGSLEGPVLWAPVDLRIA